MLRDSDNSMMAILPAAESVRTEDRPIETRVPVFRASLDGAQGNAQPGDRKSAQIDPALWKSLETGLRQRFEAVQASFRELMSGRRIPTALRESRAVTEMIRRSVDPVGAVNRSDVAWVWFGSTDVLIDDAGDIRVLDHDFSVPMGFEKLLMSRGCDAADAIEEGKQLFARQTALDRRRGEMVLLDPGPFSVALRENEFLARCLGATLARRDDLTVRPDGVYVRMAGTLRRVSTIVRRVDDDLLDPNCLRPDSLVGVPGLIKAWKSGQVQVLNPPCTALAGLRSFGRLIPTLVRELLSQDPLLETVDTLECSDPQTLKMVLTRPDRFVVRTNDPLHPARPFFGPTGTATELSDTLTRVRRDPAAWVARPVLAQPGCAVNLRLFASLNGDFRMIPAGLVRPCQSDGGATPILSSDVTVAVVGRT